MSRGTTAPLTKLPEVFSSISWNTICLNSSSVKAELKTRTSSIEPLKYSEPVDRFDPIANLSPLVLKRPSPDPESTRSPFIYKTNPRVSSYVAATCTHLSTSNNIGDIKSEVVPLTLTFKLFALSINILKFSCPITKPLVLNKSFNLIQAIIVALDFPSKICALTK